jgi:hypothetical protein
MNADLRFLQSRGHGRVIASARAQMNPQKPYELVSLVLPANCDKLYCRLAYLKNKALNHFDVR